MKESNDNDNENINENEEEENKEEIKEEEENKEELKEEEVKKEETEINEGGTELEEKEEKEINPDLLNDDPEESLKIEKIAVETKPYFSSNVLPKSIYLQQTVLPLIYEALNQTEKIRPKDPIEFFAVYLLDKNKKDVN